MNGSKAPCRPTHRRRLARSRSSVTRACLTAALSALWLPACDGDDETTPSEPEAASCPDFNPKAGVKHAVSGNNGSFTDHCDENGDLVQYGCALTSQTLCEGEYCTEVWSQSDEVEPTTVACGGTCHDGMCIGRCPSDGSAVEFESVSMDGSASVRSLETARLLACQLTNHTFASEDELPKFLAGPLTVWIVSLGEPLCLPGNPGEMVFHENPSDPMPGWDCVGI